uniref:Regulation of wnt receptor signaling pathway n=1 Tax=Rhipicephalus appendiculatus TaxID=34631 RepID=A0A131YZR3_RHIAP
MAFQHQPGTAMQCLSIPIKLAKEVGIDSEGREVMKCGFKIGGGIDQDFTRSPQGYTDNVRTPDHLYRRSCQFALVFHCRESTLRRFTKAAQQPSAALKCTTRYYRLMATTSLW